MRKSGDSSKQRRKKQDDLQILVNRFNWMKLDTQNDASTEKVEEEQKQARTQTHSMYMNG